MNEVRQEIRTESFHSQTGPESGAGFPHGYAARNGGAALPDGLLKRASDSCFAGPVIASLLPDSA